jgi:hypothetical protein
MEEGYRRIQEMNPVRETFKDEAGPSEPQQEEVTPDPKVKGKRKLTKETKRRKS